jgi:hypothetical protein
MRPPTTGCRCCRGATCIHTPSSAPQAPNQGTRTAAPLRSAGTALRGGVVTLLLDALAHDAGVGQMISRFFQMVLLSRPISSTISSLSYSGERHAQGVKQPSPLSHAGALSSKPTSSLYSGHGLWSACWPRLHAACVSKISTQTSARAQTFRVPCLPFTVSIAAGFPSPHSASLLAGCAR